MGATITEYKVYGPNVTIRPGDEVRITKDYPVTGSHETRLEEWSVDFLIDRICCCDNLLPRCLGINDCQGRVVVMSKSFIKICIDRGILRIEHIRHASSIVNKAVVI